MLAAVAAGRVSIQGANVSRKAHELQTKGWTNIRYTVRDTRHVPYLRDLPVHRINWIGYGENELGMWITVGFQCPRNILRL